MTKRTQNPRELAEIVAIQALSFVAGDPERLGVFLAETGVGPEFAAASELDPATIAAAREVLDQDSAERDEP